jgi:hypothetical protein
MQQRALDTKLQIFSFPVRSSRRLQTSDPSHAHRNLATLAATAAAVLATIVLSGCAAYTSASSSKGQTADAAASGVLSPGSTSVGFGPVAVGSNMMQTLTVTNTGTEPVVVGEASISGPGFSIVGSSPKGLFAAGQSATIRIQFVPQLPGTASGRLTVTSNASDSSLTVALSGTGTEAGISVTPASVNFGNVGVGSSSSQTVTVNNTGTANLTISQDSVTGAGFSVTGLSAQTIAPGSGISFSAVFAPTAAGGASGSISLTTDAANSPTTIALSGTGTQAALSVTPSSVNFGSVAVGSNDSQAITLKNVGSTSLVISQESVAGTGFSVNGFSAQTLAPGNTTTFNAVFTPTAGGNASGSISVTTDASASPTTVALSGTGMQAGISATPSSVNFAGVVVGSSSSQAIALKNTGTENLTISQDSVTGAGFSVNGLSPQTIAPGNSVTFNAVFAPAAAGGASGSISVNSNAPGSPMTIPLSGSGTQAAISISPSSVSFGSVVDGNVNSQPIILKNTGAASLTISQDSVTGAGFSVTGLSAQTIAPGSGISFSAVFAPTSAGSVSGSISVTTNAPGSPATISLSGTGTTTTLSLGASPTSLSFASTNVGSNSSLAVTLTNNGNSNITISGVNSTNAAFTTNGAGAGTILTPGQVATLNVVFTPTAAGSASGTVTVASNATSVPAISVSGTGAQVSHSVDLAWGASSSTDVVGYNVYQGTVSGGPYTKLTSSPVSALQYVDSTVQAVNTYYYVVTSVASSNQESAYSNQVSATIP